MNLKKFLRSFGYAFEGLILSVKVDQNVRFHLVVGTVILLLSAWLNVSTFELLFILFAIFFVIIAELINTAIEEMTNLIINEHRREAKIAKDVAAAAVLLAAVFAAIVGFMILMPKLWMVLTV